MKGIIYNSETGAVTESEITQNTIEFPQLENLYEKIVVELIRQRYSIDDELAIIRQRETKPNKFNDYFNYCEECKLKAKQ